MDDRLANGGPPRTEPDAAAAPARRTRPLSFVDRAVRVPLGLLWLGVLAAVAVPVILYMTALYHVVQGARWIAGGRRARRAGRDEAGERLARPS